MSVLNPNSQSVQEAGGAISPVASPTPSPSISSGASIPKGPSRPAMMPLSSAASSGIAAAATAAASSASSSASPAATRHRNQQTVVFAHGPGCPDGIVAAWAYWRRLSSEERTALSAFGGKYADRTVKDTSAAPRADTRSEDSAHSQTSVEGATRILREGAATAFVLVQPSAVVPADLVEGRHVIILDLHLERCLEMILAKAATVFVADHHKSGGLLLLRLATAIYPQFSPLLESQPTDGSERIAITCGETRTSLTITDLRSGMFKTVLLIGGIPRFLAEFDMSRSGAQIAWEYFENKPAPPLVSYVQDRDLWKWELQDSQAVNEAIYVGDHLATFPSIENFYKKWASEGASLTSELAYDGTKYLEYQRRLVDNIARRAFPMQMESGKNTYNVLVVNTSSLVSEIGNHVLTKYAPMFEKRWKVHFVAIWNYTPADDRIYVSCRATRADVDLSSIVTSPVGGIGGGGHPRAAGFAIQGCRITDGLSPSPLSQQLSRRPSSPRHWPSSSRPPSGRSPSGHQ